MRRHVHVPAILFIVIVLFLTSCRGKEFTAVFSTPQGPVEVRLELAVTPEERRRGLMYRQHLGDEEGMLFCFEEDGKHVFWMKNTYLSLDILFLSAQGVVVDVLERLPPCVIDPCPTYASGVAARYALEVKAGFVEKHGVRVGDRVRLHLAGERRATLP